MSLQASDDVRKVKDWIMSRGEGSRHHGFPVLDDKGRITGFVTRRDLYDADSGDAGIVAKLVKRPPAVVFEDNTLREAADHMVRERLGRLPVVSRKDPRKVVGIISRADLLSAHQQRLQEEGVSSKALRLGTLPKWRSAD